MTRRARPSLKGPWTGLSSLAQRVVTAFGEGTRPRRIDIERFLRRDAPLQRALRTSRVRVGQIPLEAPLFSPAATALREWPTPTIQTTGELASFLGVSPRELNWLGASAGRFDGAHYKRRWIRKRAGHWRLLEAPKPRLKSAQRLVLEEILAHIPPHDVACGFVPGRSVRDFVAPHVARSVVLRMDLRDFFPSIRRARVMAMFIAAGYPEAVAGRLADLCTCETPLDTWRHEEAPDRDDARATYRARHLPQGAPTSPALANLCAFRMDLRLSGLAAAAGARFTRYADDLAFSGGDDVSRGARRFLDHAAAIAMEEGFFVNHRKTRVQRRGVRQRLAGVVVNVRPGVSRADRDRLKAILHRCVRFGPQGENRSGHTDFQAHLRGRIAWVESQNQPQAQKLRRLFDKIRW